MRWKRVNLGIELSCILKIDLMNAQKNGTILNLRLVLFETSKKHQSKKKKGNVVENLGGCRFVPLIGDDAWEN